MDLFELVLDCLGLEYHLRCEEFDQRFCTGRDKHGYAIPINGCEMTAINRNAYFVRQELWQKAQLIGATPAQFQKAVSNAAPKL